MPSEALRRLAARVAGMAVPGGDGGDSKESLALCASPRSDAVAVTAVTPLRAESSVTTVTACARSVVTAEALRSSRRSPPSPLVTRQNDIARTEPIRAPALSADDGARIATLAALLLAEHDRNPAIKITDRSAALAYFTARASAELDSCRS